MRTFDGWAAVSWSLCLVLGLLSPAALGEEPQTAPAERPESPAERSTGLDPMMEPVFIEGIRIEGVRGDVLTAEDLMDVEVRLSSSSGGEGVRVYYTPVASMPRSDVRIGDLGRDPQVRTALDASAINAILKSVSKAYRDVGIGAVRVYITKDDLQHLRAEDSDGILVIRVTEGRIGDVGTVAVSVGPGGVAGEQARDSWIRRESPVQPGDPLKVDELNDYVRSVNRHPRRHVSVEVRPGRDVGEVDLDFLVRRERPWLIFAQIDNTGTKTTSELRERFGFRHFNLTGMDDIFSLDYVTGDFDDVHYVSGSYEFPVPTERKLRIKVFGSGSEYTASEVGLLEADFEGDSYEGGFEASYQTYQSGDFFLDLFGGARYRHAQTDNKLSDVSGEADFIIPRFGVRADYVKRYSGFKGEVFLDIGLTDEEEDELAELGRADVDDGRWNVFRYSMTAWTYLETLGRQFDRPVSLGTPMHEVFFRLDGQQTLSTDTRVPPQFMYPAGGYYSVRGYPESVVSGDTAIVGRLEYRAHLPRLLPRSDGASINLLGKKLRVQPDLQGRPPQWDLILRAFVDAGWTHTNSRMSYESNESLTSAGFGAGLVIDRHLDARVDVGVPLTDVDSGTTEVGQGEVRVHFSVGLSY